MAQNVFAGQSFGDKTTGAGEVVACVGPVVWTVLAYLIVPGVMTKSVGCLTQEMVGGVAVTGGKDFESITSLATVLRVSGPKGFRGSETSVCHAGGIVHGAIILARM